MNQVIALPSEGQEPPQPAGASADDLLMRVRAQMDEDGLSQATVAREAGISSSTLSQMFSGSYRGDVAGIADLLGRWLAQRTARGEAHAVAPNPPSWLPTPTGEEILAALVYAQTYSDIAIIYGGAGFGKTRAIRRHATTAPNVWVVEASPAIASVGTLLEEIALSVGLRDMALHPARLHRAIVAKVRYSGGLIVIDEAQHLTRQALEAARAIHDQAEVGLALSGNAAVYERLYGGSQSTKESFAQIFSRVGYRVRLTRPKDGDVDAIATAFRIDGVAERKYLRELAKKPGALRTVVKTCRRARTAALGAEAPIEVELLRAAWAGLGLNGDTPEQGD